MKVVSTVTELKKQIKELCLSPVGFVPTMGALHEGHISLVRNASIDCPLVVISIFVNPTQFNDKKDLKNYPRTINEDLSLLKNHLRDDDLVFTPDVREVYPSGDKRVFDFGNLDNVMEARHRPGHFNGVAQVVSRLFDIVQPDFAYFGMKDFQQVAVIKALVKQLNLKVRIVGNPIIREADGLAMSSRNRLLEPAIREKASIIFSALSGALSMIKDKEVDEIKKYVRSSIEKEDRFRIEYFEIVDDTDLIPVNKRGEMKIGKRYYGCIAVRAGKIRLIDNIEIPMM